ncbi:SMP-30/gluconolactonase/LRE family protein [Bradyrhizobium sp. AUGA SZCCT0042]|uniref:SMP-30/gluconolactonase/LRE family protein n=1 Tax=Bradyrhizobium sp. AUGA SZCCT0042 TaxID=2807651 RepID=UPI001BA7A984|nr:SMP-30/gluconolactonase/LRE family protein [Bradyrhizobium sp. AUGA SZCCT0042]MBR1297375.1 SMP-30/gluconolactonase/LRE family protein [Bradyrhizobium sp. AUGA SZCCT0042]
MAITFSRISWCLCCSAILLAFTTPSTLAEPRLFESSQVTPAGEYTSGIEGPATDLGGNLFVVNIGKPGTIGKLAAGGANSEKFIDLPEGSVGNSIRFARDGTMFIADYKKHNIFEVRKGSLDPVVWFHSDLMSQPNDMTIARDGAIYASDPNWKGRSGQIWRIAKTPDGSVRGQVMTAPRAMGTTNGIDLSPDGNTLYVGESNSGQIWSYAIRGNDLTSARLIKTFEPDTIDGLRTDVSGRLLVARIQKGTIAVIKPNGTVQKEIALKGKEPTNLSFGGKDGKTVFVTQRQGGFIESFRTDQEGREHCLQRPDC